MANERAEGYNNGTYTFEQQVFCLSWATSLSFNLTGDAQQIASRTRALLVDVLDDPAVRKLIGVWTIVWGPGIYAKSLAGPNKSLNCMFIAVPEQDPALAVVAIAGTNGSSLMDWVVEDFNVLRKVRWPYGSSALKPQISAGAMYGLDKLVKMKAADAVGNPPVTAREFLAGGSFAKIMVTGHSLGGALSPCYTLYLDETRPAWDPSQSVALSCLTTAGPTPGDISFSHYYDTRLKASTRRIWNMMDVAPHAYNTLRLGQIPNLYAPQLYSPRSPASFSLLQRFTFSQNYLNVLPDAEGFSSKFYKTDDFRQKTQGLADQVDQASKKFSDVLKTYQKKQTRFSPGFWLCGSSQLPVARWPIRWGSSCRP